MKIDKYTEVTREPVLNYSDSMFFGGFGFILSFFLLLFSQFELPSQMDRGFLTSLLFDHIPFNTISILLLSMVIILLVSAAFGKIRGSSEKLLKHLSNRISQFCSPAFFILIGNSLALILFFLCSSNIGYLGYASAFSVFALLIFLISKLSNELVDSIESVHAKLPSRWAMFFSIVLLVLPLILSYFDDTPKVIEVSLSVEQYDQVKSQAASENIPIGEYARRGLLQQ
ncbi:hypothetical protein [Vibrio cidicii]|uniref:hypothetical protein n=1 Tax=Vibrio cidicii TaxID=1763883 RepID=UPI000AB6258D|nr:hypothetical protein [Vibrio cidicii]